MFLAADGGGSTGMVPGVTSARPPLTPHDEALRLLGLAG